jgi:multisubunit Na+/H+ antiporter MnhC subunit
MIFSHLKIKKLISAYLDGEATEKEKQLVEDHLKQCEGCKKYFQALQKVSFALSQDKGEDVSPDLEQRIKTNFLGDKYKGVAKMNKNKLVIGISSGALAILLMFVLVGQMYVKRSTQARIYEGADWANENYKQGVQIFDLTGKTLLPSMDGNRQESTGHRGYGSELSKNATKLLFDRRVDDKEKYVSSQITSMPVDEAPIVIVEPYLPATGQEDKLIRSAGVGLEVKDVQKAYEEVVRISKEKKGYLATANFNEHRTGKIGASIVLRVPKEKFEETVDEIRKIGEVKRFDIQGVDVSRDYNALTTELSTLKVVYDKIVEKLKEKKTDINNAIRLESELTPIAKRMENIRDQIAKYDNLISMSTITVNLYATSWRLLLQENLKEVKQKLVELFANFIKCAVDALPAIMVIASLCIVLAVAVFVAVRVAKKIFKKKTSDQENEK